MAVQDHDDIDDIPAGGKGLKSMVDGEYEMEIDAASLKTTKDGRKIFEYKLTVVSQVHEGLTFEHPVFLHKKDEEGTIKLDERRVGEFRTDLDTLGFDEANWKKATGRPFFEELVKAAELMPGLRVKCKKTTNKGYHNLQFVERILGVNGKPDKFTSDDLNAAVAEPFSV